jgi:hypothetical protein
MEVLMRNYLEENFYVATSDMGHDGIYTYNDSRKHNAPYPNAKLINDLETVFSVDVDLIKKTIEHWARSKKEDIDLSFYWLTPQEIKTNLRSVIKSIADSMKNQNN